MVADKVMPTLPLSIMNVMDGMRGTQEMVVLGESSVNEAATAPAGLCRLWRSSADDHHQIGTSVSAPGSRSTSALISMTRGLLAGDLSQLSVSSTTVIVLKFSRLATLCPDY